MDTRHWRILTPTAESGTLEVEAQQAEIQPGGILILRHDDPSGGIVLALAPGQWSAVAPLEHDQFQGISWL